jgi:hypothetical protein
MVAAVVGCGARTYPDANPTEATDILRMALDAWKKGETPESLHQRQPPIYFNEPEHKAGTKLIDYKMEGSPGMYGRQVRCMVSLTLESKGGKKTEKDIPYLVDTTPNNVIAREGL